MGGCGGGCRAIGTLPARTVLFAPERVSSWPSGGWLRKKTKNIINSYYKTHKNCAHTFVGDTKWQYFLTRFWGHEGSRSEERQDPNQTKAQRSELPNQQNPFFLGFLKGDISAHGMNNYKKHICRAITKVALCQHATQLVQFMINPGEITQK